MSVDPETIESFRVLIERNLARRAAEWGIEPDVLAFRAGEWDTATAMRATYRPTKDQLSP